MAPVIAFWAILSAGTVLNEPPKVQLTGEGGVAVGQVIFPIPGN